MRILCISPSFVPLADSEAYCGAKMIRALISEGAQVDIIRLDKAALRSNKIYDSSSYWSFFEKFTYDIEIPSKRNNFLAIYSSIKNRTFYWTRWLSHLLIFCEKKHKEKKYDLVYSRSLPMMAHIGGYLVSKKLKIPWVANINDPWDFFLFPERKNIEVSFFYKIYSLYWLSVTLKKADIISFPSIGLCDYMKKVGKIKFNSIIIPHVGWRSEEEVEIKEEFKLVHTGKLENNEFTGKRFSNSLLLGIRLFFDSYPEAKRFSKFIFVGPKVDLMEKICRELNILENCKMIDRVSYEKSLLYIKESAVCLLIEGNNSGIYLPSKLADYIISEKPVLALSPAKGTIADLGIKGGIIRVNPDDIRGVARAIEILYNAYKDKKLDKFKPPKELIEIFNGRNIAKKFFDAVFEIINKGKKEFSNMKNR